MDSVLAKLGNEIEDVDEETFDIFSQPAVSQDLGMVDPKAPLLEISIAGRDFELSQSPGILQSARGGGTTGAAVWKSSVLLAEWMAWPQNPLFASDSIKSVIELGAGISGLVPLIVAPRVRKVVATDQAYVMKALQANIAANTAGPASKQKRKSSKNTPSDVPMPQSNIEAFALDWESDDVASVLRANGLESGLDLVLACDCVYNYALIDPLVQCCEDIGKMRLCEDGESPGQTTLFVIAQQLRQPDVFEQWLEAFHRAFRIWRVPNDLLSTGLKTGSGFVVHVGVLRQASR
ncbi:uncharacterized protein RCC_05444 [Ramularia collo-cygni]|uniref:Uncharacterized protein n=1 Tax=Ramularia collo-cygni TaxID=112498 RepID=A0A2D3VG17_9PEZI|nr:uncharacterized protein RCC_05444 [Ramularia collo-cygni]CZT19593.1 uncharacterized protein RCC_05444 [Ramularia collo-cygni]